MCWEYNSFIQLVHKEIILPEEKTTMELKMLKLLVFERGQSFLIVDIDGTIETVNEADPEISRVWRFNKMLLQGAEQEQDRGADKAEQEEGQGGDVALSEYLRNNETFIRFISCNDLF